MATAPEPIRLPPDYKPAPLAQQIEAITRRVRDVDADQQRGRIHPQYASLLRYELKSVLHTLQRVAGEGGTAKPAPASTDNAAPNR